MKTALLALVIIALCASGVMAGENESLYKTDTGSQDVAVSGKIFFSDYYSMGGEKCAAFLETEDGALICVLDNLKTNDLKGDMGLTAGRVKVTGSMVKDSHGKYLKVEDYEVKDKKGTPKNYTAQKGSGDEPEGSHE
ncbi:MAG: hypothetical protein ABH875_07585 [Candidatus Omnitrophota bacterium]